MNQYTTVNQEHSISRRRAVIRVFVSSTFTDLRHERDALQGDTFQRLERLCAARQFQFQAIDLRWGIPNEAGLDHRTMRICFEELRRCQEVSPRPNFLILLGDRYGWRPLPEEISCEEFNTLFEHAETQKQTILERWYVKDENAIPPVFILQSRKTSKDDGKDYKLECEWKSVETVLWSIINRVFHSDTLRDRYAAPAENESIPAIVRFQGSATEQEIWHGAFHGLDAPGHVRAFVRTIDNIRDYPATKIKAFVDINDAGEVDEGSRTALMELKEALKTRLGADNVDESCCNVHIKQTHDGNCESIFDVTTDHLQNLCKKVYEALEPIVIRQMDEYWAESTPGKLSLRELERECDEHTRFGLEHAPASAFIGRRDHLRAITSYLLSDSSLPLMVYGASGCGKTSLLAKAVQEAQGQKPIVRFIGATAKSSDLRSLLQTICGELRQRNPRNDSLPVDTRKLFQELLEQFQAATAQKPLILFLDALDQLADTDNALQLHWIPFGELPNHVKIIVSCLSDRAQDNSAGQPFNVLKARKVNEISLDIFSEEEAKKLLFDYWLPLANRKLKPNGAQDQIVRDQLKRMTEEHPASGLCCPPLYLKILFEEIRLWRSYDTPPSSIGKDVPALLKTLLDRLALPENHDQTLESALSYIASGRHGLTENEILEVLYQDHQYREFLSSAEKRTGQRLPDKPARIPIAIWSRLRTDLAAYLTERAVPGGTVLTFYHRQVGEFVRNHYLVTPAIRQYHHRYLARVFRRTSSTGRPRLDSGHPRQLQELVFHLRRSGSFGQSHLNRIINTFAFIECFARTTQIGDLLDQYHGENLFQQPDTEANSAAMAIMGACRDQGQILTSHPELTFQTIYNHVFQTAAQSLDGVLQRWRTWARRKHPGLPRLLLLSKAIGTGTDGKLVIDENDCQPVMKWGHVTYEVRDQNRNQSFICVMPLAGHKMTRLGPLPSRYLLRYAISCDCRHILLLLVGPVSQPDHVLLNILDHAGNVVFEAEVHKHTQAVATFLDEQHVLLPMPGCLRIVNIHSKESQQLELREGEQPLRSTAGADGMFAVATRLAGPPVQNQVTVYHLKNLSIHLIHVQETSATILDMAIAQYAPVIAVLDIRRTVYYCNVTTNRHLQLLKHPGSTLSISTDGRYAFTTGDDCRIAMWDFSLNEPVLFRHTTGIAAQGFYCHNELLYVLDMAGHTIIPIRISNITGGNAAVELSLQISSSIASRNGRLIACASGLSAFLIHPGERSVMLYGGRRAIRSMSFSPDASSIYLRDDTGYGAIVPTTPPFTPNPLQTGPLQKAILLSNGSLVAQESVCMVSIRDCNGRSTASWPMRERLLPDTSDGVPPSLEILAIAAVENGRSFACALKVGETTLELALVDSVGHERKVNPRRLYSISDRNTHVYILDPYFCVVFQKTIELHKFYADKPGLHKVNNIKATTKPRTVVAVGDYQQQPCLIVTHYDDMISIYAIEDGRVLASLPSTCRDIFWMDSAALIVLESTNAHNIYDFV